MKYKVVVFDIDGTVTKHISSWRYIHEKLGLWDVLAKKYQEQFLAGQISYKKFCQLDAEHWKGMDNQKIHNVFKKVEYSKNVVNVIRRLKKEKYKLIAVSTGLQFITDRVKKELKFDYVIGNRLNIYEGKLTGGVTINISHGEKGKVIRKIAKMFKVKIKEVIAIGDSDGDIPMMSLAGYSIAFNSESRKLSNMVDYNCKSKDFMEVYKRIKEINDPLVIARRR